MTRADLARSGTPQPVHPQGRPGGWLRTSWRAVTAAFGAILGLAPHVLHHVGFLAGTALVAGSGGTLLFAVVGFAASVPMLLRLKRRFSSWWAPTLGLAVFATMFSITAFVIGPAISDTGSGSGGSSPTNVVDHNSHH